MGLVILTGPILKCLCEFVVGDDIDFFDALDGGEVVDNPLHHGFTGDGEEWFWEVEGKGIESSSVTCG